MSEYLTETERGALAEMALLYGTFLMGRFAEVMSSDQEPADDWQEQAAREAVDLFGPGARQVLDASKAEAWDEGWAARAEYDTRRDVPLDWPDLNPYRAPAVSPEDDPAFCDRGPCYLPRGHEGRCNPGNSA